jgi:uncharacterized protein (DUF697 family)
MNTVEILYQAFRVRYSLNQLQQILDRGCRIALLGPDDAVGTLKEFFGPPVPPLDGSDPAEDLIELSWELDDEGVKELRTCDACLVLFPDGPPEVDTLQELAGKIPIHVKSLFMCLIEGPKGGSYHEKDLTLPTVQALPRARAQERFLKLLMVTLPQVVVILARNWVDVRKVFCKTLTRRTALRNGIRSGISSLPLRAVPVIGPVLAMLATSAETMMLTASQLRLSFVIAAAHNRPLDFFDRISELWPIVGTAFGFRGMSRKLVKMLPNFGPGLKASIAFSGTYGIGEACRLYYEHGQPDSDEVRRELMRRAHEEGAKEAQRLFRRVLAGQPIESLEEEDGAEVEEALEAITSVEPETDELEPTVEMEAIVTDEEPEQQSKTETKPSSKDDKSTEAEASESEKSEKKSETSKKSKKTKSGKRSTSKSKKTGSKKKSSKSKKRGKKKSKDGDQD